ncbi:MAG: hypothetical protein DRH76_09955 [Deltaproteobacteria bacterium]|nr:NAD(P)-dependent oxidoreductase [Deltaproteobacteria bacterium]RLB93684.1 MAG: hypothetical protein DRH76_09955 [Deltaproteobacteria bacterium]
MKVFITGISGFVGRHLAEALAASGHRVIGVGGRTPVPPATKPTAPAKKLDDETGSLP